MADTTEAAGPWMTVKELAERWSCGEEVIRRAIRSKKLQAFQVGKEYRVRASWADAYEASRTAAPR